MSDDELKLNRRLFLQHSAMISATAGLCGIAMKTDALVQAEQQQVKTIRTDGPSPYPYLATGG